MRKRGRFAKTVSCLVKHRCASVWEETTTARREPNQREKMWPCFWEREWRERWSRGFLRWWRFPIMGRVGTGHGGRFLNVLKYLCSKSL